MYQHYLNPFLIKQQLKSVDLSPKWFFWMSKPPFRHIFPSSNLQSLTVAIPEIFAQTQVNPIIGSSFIGQLKISGTKS